MYTSYGLETSICRDPVGRAQIDDAFRLIVIQHCHIFICGTSSESSTTAKLRVLRVKHNKMGRHEAGGRIRAITYVV